MTMCGRYVVEIGKEAAEDWGLIWGIPEAKAVRSYNVAPSQQVPIVRRVDGRNVVSMVRFGLIPFWARGEPPKYSTINATVERLKDAPTWRGPWRHGHRCVILASGFYEWQVQADGKTKQPFYVTSKDQERIGFAGLWDSSVGTDGVSIESCAIITLPANPLMAEIHNAKARMPAMLGADAWDTWLGGTPDEAFAELRQYPESKMDAWKVSKRVNAPQNNDAGLLERR